MARKGASTLVGLSAPRVIVVPRWGGTPNDDWYPWLADELRGTTVLDLPNPPTVEAWVDGVIEGIGTDPYALARTLVIGHSVGCRAVLGALASLPSGRAVHSVLCVAGWWTLDEPWPEIQPFIDLEVDLTAAREGYQNLHVLLSTNDPFTADSEANAALWIERLDATVVTVPEAGHFNGKLQPAVLQSARELYGSL